MAARGGQSPIFHPNVFKTLTFKAIKTKGIAKLPKLPKIAKSLGNSGGRVNHYEYDPKSKIGNLAKAARISNE